mmetsp:Transcript_16895/g.23909  ORF Transcript_16895/g.23909 Transcript_16895/m.23909 type:complete len:246 (+) Transcript_16895:26-763(+)
MIAKQSSFLFLILFCIACVTNSFFSASCVTKSTHSISPTTTYFKTESTSENEQKVASNLIHRSKANDDDLLQTPQFLTKKIEVLNKQIAKKEEEISAANLEADKEWEEWGPQIERLEREFENVRARMLNDTMEASTSAKVKVLKEILAVSDNFMRASQAISPSTEGEIAVVDYYKSIYEEMQAVFVALGMKPIATVGEPFDYNLHEAVMRQSSEFDEDIVCLELTKGFMVGEELIRPAMVAVSTG